MQAHSLSQRTPASGCTLCTLASLSICGPLLASVAIAPSRMSLHLKDLLVLSTFDDASFAAGSTSLTRTKRHNLATLLRHRSLTRSLELTANYPYQTSASNLTNQETTELKPLLD